MLVLARKKDQIIDIGDEIYVQVVRIGGDAVKLGIHAPKHIQVNRREITERMNRKRLDEYRDRLKKETP